MPHTHAHNHLDKGAIDRVPLEPWLQHLAARLAGRTPRDIYVGAAFGAIEMLHSGTTWACEMANVLPWRTGAALDAVVQAYVDVGVRASINVQVLDLSSPPRYALDEMLAAVRVAVERLARRGRRAHSLRHRPERPDRVQRRTPRARRRAHTRA